MRKESFLYVVELSGKRDIVRAVSPGRAANAVYPAKVHRASVEDVAMHLGNDKNKIINGMEESNG